MRARFLWRFPYLERVQGALDRVPRGLVGRPGLPELAAPTVTVGIAKAGDIPDLLNDILSRRKYIVHSGVSINTDLVVDIRFATILFRAAVLSTCSSVHAPVLNPQAIILVENIILLIDAYAEVERRRIGCLSPVRATGADSICTLSSRNSRRGARGSWGLCTVQAVRFTCNNDSPGR